MTQASSGTAGRTTDEAKHEAARVADESKDAGRRVAETAKDEAGRVADEAKVQAKRVYHEMSGELQKQADEQQTRAAEAIRSMSDEMRQMAQSSEQQGMASDLVRQAGQRLGDVAGWLEQRDAGSMVREVKNYARRHPGAFIAIAAGAGLVIGRFIRASSSQGRGQEHDRQLGTMPQYDRTRGYEETTPVYEEAIAEHEVPVAGRETAATTTPAYEETVYDETTSYDDTTQSGEVRR